MSTQLPILTYTITPPTTITNGSTVQFSIMPRNRGKLDARNVRLRLSVEGANVTPSTPIELGTIEAEGSLNPQPFTVTLPRTFPEEQLQLRVQLSQAQFDGLERTERYPVTHIEPNLTIADRVTDASGDGKIQQGERVELELTVANEGKLSAENAQIRVSASDASIRIDNPERRLGQLAPNFTSNPERFVFVIPRAVPAGNLPITVEVTHADFPKVTQMFNYTVHAEGMATTTVKPTQPQQTSQNLTNLLGVSETNIIFRTNEFATGNRIKADLSQLKRRVTPGQSDVYVFYSGHGAPTIDGKQRYLLPHDGDPDALEDTGYPLMVFYDQLSKLDARSITMFLDACFSGTDKEDNPLRPGIRPVIKVIEGEAAYENLEIFSSSTGTQISSSFDAKKHGLFTYHLLKGMRRDADSNNDGKITLTEMEAYVKAQVSNEAKRMGPDREQEPMLTGQKNRVLVRLK